MTQAAYQILLKKLLITWISILKWNHDNSQILADVIVSFWDICEVLDSNDLSVTTPFWRNY